MCQRDFVCKLKSHDKYPIKKHVFVCHEHRNDTENQELLQKYKDRFIMKQPNQLPSFSRDLKLSFQMNQNQSPNSQEMSDEVKAIYILQTIKVEQQEYSLFYDTGCFDMVSCYAPIKSIGKRASKGFSGPVTLGVGNAQITSSHGTYQVKLPLFNGNDAVLSGVCLYQITVEFPKYLLKGQKLMPEVATYQMEKTLSTYHIYQHLLEVILIS